MYKIFPILLVFLISACGPQTVKSDKPTWIDNPQDGAVGSSTTHIKGRHYQEDLAITRAREKLAAVYGVEISSVQTIKQRVANNKGYVTSNKEIKQTIKNQTVKAHVRETWHDKARDVMWVWVYPVN